MWKSLHKHSCETNSQYKNNGETGFPKERTRVRAGKRHASSNLREKSLRGEILSFTRLKIELLCKGAKTRENIEKGRKGGAGPTGGQYFILPDGTCVGIPVRAKFVENSPFSLIQKEGKWFILKGKKTAC